MPLPIIAPLGHSMVSNSFNPNTPNAIVPRTQNTELNTRYARGGLFANFAARMGGVADILCEGVAGETSTQILTRMTAAMPRYAGYSGVPRLIVPILATRNDRGAADLSAQTSIDNVRAMVEKLLRANHRPMLITDPIGATVNDSAAYSGRISLAQEANRLAVADAVRAMRSEYRIPLWDMEARTRQIGLNPGWTNDGIHPNAVGSQVLNEGPDGLINAVCTGFGLPIPTPGVPPGFGANQLTNTTHNVSMWEEDQTPPAFGAGKLVPIWAFTRQANWANSDVMQLYRGSRSDGSRFQGVRFTGPTTATAGGSAWNNTLMRFELPAFTVPAGQTFKAGIRIVGRGLLNCIRMSLAMRVTDTVGTRTYAASDYSGFAPEDIWASDFDEVIVTPEYTAPVGSSGSVLMWLNMSFAPQTTCAGSVEWSNIWAAQVPA